MSDLHSLSTLTQGRSAVVKDLTVSGSMRRRLQDIGLIEGTRVKCLQKSPLGDPVAFLVRGAVIALRAEDSARILVQHRAD